MWNRFKLFFAGLFGSPSIRTLASTGVVVGLAFHPELRIPVRVASRQLIEMLDQDTNNVVSISGVEALLLNQLDSAHLSKDQRAFATALIDTYKPQLETYLTKVVTAGTLGADLKKMKELRELAVLVNRAAGGNK